MPCEHRQTEHGWMMICKHRDRSAKCGVCGLRRHTKLCDMPRGSGRTCDRPLCDFCTTAIAHNVDACPEHADALRRIWSGK